LINSFVLATRRKRGKEKVKNPRPKKHHKQTRKGGRDKKMVVGSCIKDQCCKECVLEKKMKKKERKSKGEKGKKRRDAVLV